MDGELVAALSPRERVDMIQKGYIPGRKEDVIRYRQGQPPTGEAVDLATYVTEEGQNFNSLGEKKIKGGFNFQSVDPNRAHEYVREYGMAEQFESSSMEFAPKTSVDPRESVKQSMDNYKGSSSLDSKINNLMGNVQKQAQTQQRTSQQQSSKQPQQRPLLTTPKNMLKEEQVIANGYKDGVKYLNAFIRLLKDPSITNRETLIEAINTFITAENGLPSQMVESYRAGLSKAESKMYQQIKAAKGNG